jgi:hypothetical protein
MERALQLGLQGAGIAADTPLEEKAAHAMFPARASGRFRVFRVDRRTYRCSSPPPLIERAKAPGEARFPGAASGNNYRIRPADGDQLY